jgi:hypothetical protein
VSSGACPRPERWLAPSPGSCTICPGGSEWRAADPSRVSRRGQDRLRENPPGAQSWNVGLHRAVCEHESPRRPAGRDRELRRQYLARSVERERRAHQRPQIDADETPTFTGILTGDETIPFDVNTLGPRAPSCLAVRWVRPPPRHPRPHRRPNSGLVPPPPAADRSRVKLGASMWYGSGGVAPTVMPR